MKNEDKKHALAESRTLLHVGCGHARAERLPVCFRAPQWREIRFDINPDVMPDIVGSLTDMHRIASASVDAVWSSHNLEHLHAYEVPRALAEFRRVLKPHGYALITLPDLRAVARHIMADALDRPLYHSEAGPIGALDVLFGHQASIARGNDYMAHRTGFTATSLGHVLVDAGFFEVRVREGKHWDLWALATLPGTGAGVFEELAMVPV